jgi:Tol biopolymer transport system component
MFTTLKSDGTWTTEGVIDPATSKPFDVAAYDLVLSPDGTKAAFTILTPGNDIEGPTFFYNLGIADVATSVITLLTHNENNPGSYAQDVYPQFAPDGKSLVYMHYGYDDATEEWMHSVRTMSIDGSNVQTIHAVLYEGAWSPSYSPDGEMIAFERAGADATGYFDGIATMNKDGGNLVQLTGYEPVNYACWGWDQMPAFTNDGVSITFTRECFPEDGGVSDMLYSMHVDGSSLVQIHGPGYAGTMSCQARTFANNSVAFSSNVNAPGTNSFEMWSVLPDGTKSMQITHNNLYDGFSVYWMNYNTMTASARAFERHSPLHQRMIHKQMTRQHKVLAK